VTSKQLFQVLPIFAVIFQKKLSVFEELKRWVISSLKNFRDGRFENFSCFTEQCETKCEKKNLCQQNNSITV
jgi:hypothetical protein